MNEVYDKLEKSTPIPLLNLRTLSETDMPDWYKYYGLGGSEFREIDYYSILKFGDFVLDKFVWDDDIYTIHQDLLMHLQKLSLLFYRQRKLTYDKLWEIESITFICPLTLASINSSNLDLLILLSAFDRM